MTTSLRTSDLHGAESRGAPLDARRYLEACGILLAVALLVMASSAMGFPISPARPIRGDPIQCGDSPPGLDLQVTARIRKLNLHAVEALGDAEADVVHWGLSDIQMRISQKAGALNVSSAMSQSLAIVDNPVELEQTQLQTWKGYSTIMRNGKRRCS
ncbi:hypothetical protein PG999_007494 [Apiospora kogelbergensis]|uniref:Uncharacterized protein n=1 Tax=Apiospora kogelbergensis TaxID=1337665 RepID=A0AAW0QYJ2_9PEZI